MTIDDTPGWDRATRRWATDVDKKLDGVLVVLSTRPTRRRRRRSTELAGHRLALSPVQAKGADPVVKGTTWDTATGTVTVPPRTVAVLVEKSGHGHGHGHGWWQSVRSWWDVAPGLTRRGSGGPAASSRALVAPPRVTR